MQKRDSARQDKTIIDYVIQMGKGLVLIVNKWDLIEKDSSTMSEFKRTISGDFKALSHYPLLFISALTHQRVSKVYWMLLGMFMKLVEYELIPKN